MDVLVHVAQWFANPAHWTGEGGVLQRLYEHVAMSAASTATAVALALPIGVFLGHTGRGGLIAINISNIGRAIPSFALLVLAFQFFGFGQLFGTGWKPAFIAMVALAIPPMITNTYVGMTEVDPDVKEAARGIGMRERAVIWRIELPLALPLILTGIRTSAVQVVATATLAALVAWGGLGRFIIDGFDTRDYAQVFAGALLVAFLAILTELSLAGVQRVVTPRGLREQAAGAGRFVVESTAAPAI